MRALPLYGAPPTLPFETTKGMDVDRSCHDCALGQPRSRGLAPTTVCMSAEGHPGGVLAVGDYPGRDEDAVGRPFYGQSGRFLRTTIQKYWEGPIAFDNAIKCAPGSMALPKNALHECLPYLSRTIEIVQPQRILACGSHAINSLLGTKLQVLTNRRGYGHAYDGTPVFIMPNPAAALRNRFIRQWFEEDLEWALTCELPPPPFNEVIRLVETEADALQAEAEITASGDMVFDVETVGPLHDPVWFRIVAFGACAIDSESVWMWDDAALENPRTREPLRRLLLNGAVGKIGSNVKYDMLSCRSDPRFNLVVNNISGDTRVWRKMLFSESDGELEVMANLVGMGGHKAEASEHLKKAIESLQKHKRKHKGSIPLPGTLPPAMMAWLRLGGSPKRFVYGMLPHDVLCRYCARDVLTTKRLAVRMREEFGHVPPIKRIWDRIVHPAVPALEQVEAWGMPVSRSAIDTLGVLLHSKLTPVANRLAAHGLKEPGSNPQVSSFLYNSRKNGGLGIKPKKFTEPSKKFPKGQPSVDAEALEGLKDEHPVVRDLLEWRKLDKLRSTYVDGMRDHIGADDRIRPDLKLDGARSGRLSCANPNLQNIPRAKGSQEAKMAKSVFVAPEGYYLLQADYSQLELRVAAMLSGDPKMIGIFQSGEDYHLRCAKLISRTAWGVNPDDVLPGSEYRSKAKGFVFGLLYGMTDGTLARRMGCSKEEAARIRAAVLGAFPQLAVWVKDCLNRGRRTGLTHTWWDGEEGRTRSLYQIASQDDGQRITAENSTYNCLDADTEALTKRGWVRGFDLRMDDEILTKNPTTGALEWQAPTDLKFWPDYEGPLVEFKSKSFHAVTTPNHRWLVTDKHSGRWIEKTSATLSRHGDHRIHRTGNYVGPDHAEFDDDFVWLAGWFLTDGSKGKAALPNYVGKPGPKPGAPLSQIHQSKELHRSRIGSTLARLERAGKITGLVHSDHPNGTRTWRFRGDYSAQLWALFPTRELDVAFLSKLTRPQLELLRDTMLDGDGHREATGKVTLYSGSRATAEAFQILVTLTGQHARCFWRDMAEYSPCSDLMENDPVSEGYWNVVVLRKQAVQVQRDHVREYTARTGVWCPMVPNTFFVARRGEHVWVTGNTPCQGTASDFCLRSVVDAVEWIKEDDVPAEVVITVHDSIVLLVRADAVEECAYQLDRIMRAHNSNGVPLVVDMEIGRSWGALTDLRYHAVQATGNFDKRFNDVRPVDNGVDAVFVRASKEAPEWLQRYEFNPVVNTMDAAARWLAANGLPNNLVEPWAA